MKIKDLIQNKRFSKNNTSIHGISENSKEIKKNYIFFFKNTPNSKEEYIDEAIKKGARLIVHDQNYNINQKKYNKLHFYAVKNLNKTMSEISEKFYGIENIKTKIYGITGTNGKTSVSNLIAQLLSIKKEKCGIIGTIGNGIYPKLKDIGLTTPNIINIHKNIKNIYDKKSQTVIVEASSHGIKQDRLLGLKFNSVIFTNLSQDHMDYHKSMRDYFDTKLLLFTMYKSKKKIICIDNYYGKKIKKILGEKKNIKTVSINNRSADYYASKIKYLEDGINFNIHSIYGKKEIKINMYGKFSIINFLLAIATIVNTKKDYETFVKNYSIIKPINGRMNKYEKKNYPITFIDFAHTPDAILNVITSIKKHFPKHEIITLFGCGGDRDKDKRKIMGRIVSDLSDKIVITDDNPRHEEPKRIYKDIISGINKKKKYTIISNRKKAIRNHLKKSKNKKVLLILGKGHEEYQIVKNKNLAHSDKKEVMRAMEI